MTKLVLISYKTITCYPSVLVYCFCINLHQVFLNLLVDFSNILQKDGDLQT